MIGLPVVVLSTTVVLAGCYVALGVGLIEKAGGDVKPSSHAIIVRH